MAASLLNRLKKALNVLRGKPPVAEPQLAELKARFNDFKHLLRANNDVLGIIAEIQNRLDESGYLGLDFLRSRYIAASAKVLLMIRHMNLISGGRYQSLLAPFIEIRLKADDLLAAQAGGEARNPFLPLESVLPGMEHLCGAKAANLAQLAREGLPVPPGLVISTAAFRRVMDESGLDATLRKGALQAEGREWEALERFSRRIADEFERLQLPADLERELVDRAAQLSEAHGGASLSIRSSALGEDTQSSFAGLYQTRLGVRPVEVPRAYREVLGSLFTTQALAYRGRQGLADADAEMAALVQVMVTPAASGVLYTRDPLGGGEDLMLVSAVPGLGLGLGDGSIDPDVYAARAGERPVVNVRNLGRRGHYLELGPEGPRRRELDAAETREPLVLADAVLELVQVGARLQDVLGGPLDVEWVRDREGRFWILQARPLSVLEWAGAGARVRVSAPMLLSGGQTARPGAGCGPVFLVNGPEDMAAFRAGGVLVARESSPSLASLLPAAAAVVTEVGGVAGHLAALAREYGVPALLGARGALSRLPATETVTVDASGRKVYSGRVGALLDQEVTVGWARSTARAAPIWLTAAQLISRLNLTDPRSRDFSPKGCRSFHDLIRYMHELSFLEMFNLGDEVGQTAGAQARRLHALLPFELWFVDLGGGLADEGAKQLEPGAVISRPAAAFLGGLLDPRVHWGGPRPLSLKGLASVFTGTLLTPPNSGQIRDLGNRAYAVVGEDYFNFSCRVGYHFTALDCYSGSRINDNYIGFRFHGGAATEDRRSLRAEMVERILQGLEFAVERNGDAVSAFLKKRSADEIEKVLAEMGRLVLFTRQMDMLMDGPAMVEWLARAFARGDYNLSRAKPEPRP